MLLMPAIDLRAGRCVRLQRGDFAAETRYDVSPEQLLERYRALGASWVHVVDLDGARQGVLANRAIILALASCAGMRLQVGGGVRAAHTLAELLQHGVARVVVGSRAVEQPQEVCEWLARFGAERLCLAFDVRLDARGEPRVHTHGWTAGGTLSLWRALEPFRAHGLRHVLCTDIERDGALAGPSLELYREAVQRCPDLAWQASGGVRDAADLAALAHLGVHAAVSGKALLETRMNPEELRPFLPNASSPASTYATDAS
ncbi:MAG TPA: 1-(5-phosphoribosyl)-5-[(5-phosphoribosylamino)methylideneamino] imidazole-4-carboxamide isomerase [Steroidobacteraceae bacterium]|nr:1-(5-phosphoribosyl)-5-[(5-phosphoribosylamino)methylideneamino] imidazole-4-carboxamide isomerase [Steroidobacteraceae bacterium]